MKQVQVLVLYNAPTLDPADPEAEAERQVVDSADVVVKALKDAGFAVSRLRISSDPAPLLRCIRDSRPNVIFNLFEGTAEQGETEAYAIGLLEWLNIPYTGCPSQAVVIARDKPRAKLLLQGAGLPTPKFFVVEGKTPKSCPLDWPVIVKPAREDASVGLDQGSVVADQKQLIERVTLLRERFGQPVLVEEFINGREFNIAIIENPELRILPISEIVFAGQESGLLPIVTYAAKWAPGSLEDRGTVPRCPADVSSDLAARLRQLARKAFDLFGCRDYARIDFRVNSQEEPFILEVNPNPDYHPAAGLARALAATELSHRTFTVSLVQQALQRGVAKSSG